jgi:ubiquinone/menaquinone biosynthesis C-methylase UbiE
VLDIGCGTGNLLLALGRDHPGVEIEGLDPDPRPLARAARKAHRAGVAASWRPGYAQDLPHADGSVDRVFSSLMLHHLHDDKDALLAEVRRVLRPDGMLVLADIDGHTALDGHGFLRRRMAHNPDDPRQRGHGGADHGGGVHRRRPRGAPAAHGPDHDRPRASWRPVNLVLT